MNTVSQNDPLRRLRWQCRRGLLELDVLFSRFLETRYEQLSTEQKEIFNDLLQCADQDLLYWLTEQSIPPKKYAAIIIALKAEGLT